MASSKDSKGVNPSVPIPEEEQSTFGQQPPYAIGFNNTPPSSSFPIASPSILSAPPTTATSSQPSTVISPQQQLAPAATAPFAIPIQQDAEHSPHDDQPPPAYDEVAPLQPPRAPHNYYGNNNNHGYTNPSAPLLPSSGPPATSYTAIPPATPYTPDSPRSTYGGSDDGSRRFNKFWLIFLAVVVFLSITVDNDDDVGDGSCGTGFTRVTFSHTVPIIINDMYISASGLPATVVLEQRDHAGEDPDMAEIAVFVTGRDRDDIRKVKAQCAADPSTGQLKLNVYKPADSGSSGCMSMMIRLSLSPRMLVMEKLKVIVDEGNVTLAMLLPGHPLQIKDLSTRVVTGNTRIDANAIAVALGGSMGTIEGNLVVGDTMSVLMVDGAVSLNVSQSTKVMTAKVIVTNGNIDVGLVTPYVGTFRVEGSAGLVGIHHVDLATTKVKYESKKVLKGWRTEWGQVPDGEFSSLKLTTHAGSADLDMARRVVL